MDQPRGQNSENPEILQSLEDLARGCASVREQIRRVVIGQHHVVDLLLVSLFCQGHALIVGVPGLAKTLLVRTLARCLDLDFSRVQGTPDLMPSDILGTELIQADPTTSRRTLEFVRGPVFANIVLCDEINRCPPRTQAALLEAMAERQVTIGGETRALDEPFMVVATQNPIEQEGTYPLPEAQLDRFMLSLWIDYPTRAEERLIASEADRITEQPVETVFHADDLVRFRRAMSHMPISDHIVDYAIDIVRSTRPDEPSCPESVRPYIAWGAGPRASQYMLLAARCLAATEGRPTPSADDIRRIAPAVLRHRIVTSYAATDESLESHALVERIIQEVKEPDYAT